MMMAALEAPPPPASHINEQAALLAAQQDAARHVAALPRLRPHSALPLPDFNFLRDFFAQCSLSHPCACLECGVFQPASFPCQHGNRRVQTEESEKRCPFLCGGQSSVSDPELRGRARLTRPQTEHVTVVVMDRRCALRAPAHAPAPLSSRRVV